MRKLEWSLVAALLAVCAGFPIAQTIYEMAVDGEKPHVLSLFTQRPSKESLHRWDENAKDRSIFAKWLRPITLQARYDLLGEMSPKALKGTGKGRDGWLFYNQDVDYLLHPPYTDGRFYDGTFDTLIAGKRVNLRNPLVAMRDFKEKLEARGIQLLLVPIPGKPAIYPEKLQAGFQGGRAPGTPASPTLALLEELRKEGFQVADLFNPLLQAKADGSRGELYLRRDTHWTPAGMEVAAEAVAARIKELDVLGGSGPDGLAAGSGAPRYGVSEFEVERWGDIAEMTKVPARKEIWEMERVKARRVTDLNTGKPYADDARSPILWLGDSYSRIYQTDAPNAAGIIAHVARLLNTPLASVVNDGGASTVVRQQLARKGELLQGKKLVVWTFVERDLRFGSKGWQIEELPAPGPGETVAKVEGSAIPSVDGDLVMTATLKEIAGPFPANDIYNYAYIMKYEVGKVHKGAYADPDILVGHYNPRLPRGEIRDEQDAKVGGNLKSFQVGDVHYLVLSPLEGVWTGALEDDYYKDKRSRHWALWADKVAP